MTAPKSPADLSEKPSTTDFRLPAYDWDRQTRHETIAAGRYTVNSVQTFDLKGQPRDSQNDNND